MHWIQLFQKIFVSGTIKLLISKDKVKNIMKKIYLEDSCVLINGATRTIESVTKKVNFSI